MTLQEIAAAGAYVIASVGGGGAIVFGLSSYLGKIWTDRALEKQRQDNAIVNLQISHRLELDAERFKSEIKAKADAEIERMKAVFSRASRIHDRQLDVLGKLHRHLYDAQTYFQGMMRTGRRENEADSGAYEKKLAEAIEAALNEFLNGKLLVPPDLVERCEQFFDALYDGRLAADLAREVAFHPKQQNHFSKEAAEVAFKKLPSILRQIYDTGRTIIHGEAT